MRVVSPFPLTVTVEGNIVIFGRVMRGGGIAEVAKFGGWGEVLKYRDSGQSGGWLGSYSGKGSISSPPITRPKITIFPSTVTFRGKGETTRMHARTHTRAPFQILRL